jgi:exonuclease SbcC
MIKEISLTNVQSHKHSTLKLSKGINVIIGPSDSGKSAIIRTLDWLLFGGSNNGLQRTGEKEFSASVLLSEGTLIERIKSSTKNFYKIDEEEYAAFRTSVPEEVFNVLKMDREINLQTQHDPIFMLMQSAGKNGSMISEHAGLSIVETSVKKAKSELRDTKSKIEFQKDELDATNVELTALQEKTESIHRIKILVKKIEDLDDNLIDLENDESKLLKLKDKLSKIKITKTNKIQERLDKYSDSIKSLKELRKSKDELQSKLSQLNKGIKFIEIEKSITSKLEKHIESTKFLSEIENKRNRLNYLKSMQDDFRLENDLTKKLKEVQNELKGKACPTCGKEM